MTTRSHSVLRLLTLAAALTIAGCVWSYRQLLIASANLQNATSSLSKCVELHDQIVLLRSKSAEIDWLAQPEYRPGQAIDQALKTAKIEFPNLSVTASAGRAAPDSDYVEVPIGIPMLESVTLEQIITFLTALANGPTRHQINELSLTANRKEPTVPLEYPTWNLNCQISYFSQNEND